MLHENKSEILDLYRFHKSNFVREYYNMLQKYLVSLQNA